MKEVKAKSSPNEGTFNLFYAFTANHKKTKKSCFLVASFLFSTFIF